MYGLQIILFSARLPPVLKDGIIAQQKATNVTKESSIFWLLQVAHTLLYTSLQPKGLKTDTDTESNRVAIG